MWLHASRRRQLALLFLAVVALPHAAFGQDPNAPPVDPNATPAASPAPTDPAAAAAPAPGADPNGTPVDPNAAGAAAVAAAAPMDAAPAPGADLNAAAAAAAAAAPPVDSAAAAAAAPPAPPVDPAAAAPPAPPAEDPDAAPAAPPADAGAAPAPPADPADAPAAADPAAEDPDAAAAAPAPGQDATGGNGNGQVGWGWEAQCIGQYLQCGGINYWGPTNCCESHQCEFVNDYWWQCNPVPNAPAGAAAPVEPAPTPAPTRHPHHWGHHHHSHVPTVAPTPFPTEGGAPFWDQECFRVRKNILNLTPEELANFIEGLQVLKANGQYDAITAIHGDPKTFNLFHGNDFFLPWHRWYVLKIESAIRDLGGKWSCFAMPYWDWTLDAGREAESPIWSIFGPMGKKNDSFCMKEGPWAEWRNNKGGCLKRIGSDSYRFFSPAEVMDLILSKKTLVGGFRPAFEAGAHSRPHLYIGGAMNSFASPDDPIFWLHHTMVDKVWTMWQDCHQLFDPLNIAPEIFKPEELDVELAYAPGVTTRSMWSTRQLGYTYETDIMSAYSFLNVCHWFNIKPNPAIDLNLPAPPMPVLPPETRTRNGPVPSDGVPDAPKVDAAGADDAAAAAAVPQEPQLAKDEKGASSRSSSSSSNSSTPNLRGHKRNKPKPGARGSSNSTTGGGGSSSSSRSHSRSWHSSSTVLVDKAQAGSADAGLTLWHAAGFVQPLQLQPSQATKEWATAQAAVAPFEPHGKGLIIEENRVFVACMARVNKGEAGLTTQDCMKQMLKRDCELLGYICDLPEKYREGMFMAEAEDIFKKDAVCARSCSGTDEKHQFNVDMGMGGGM